MRKTIEELKEKVYKIKRQICAAERKELVQKILPKAKKLIGQCYKHLDSYASEYKPWWLYQKVTGIESVIDENRANIIVHEFAKDCYGNIQFKKKEHSFRDFRENGWIYWKKITKKEYEREKKKLVKTLENL